MGIGREICVVRARADRVRRRVGEYKQVLRPDVVDEFAASLNRVPKCLGAALRDR